MLDRVERTVGLWYDSGRDRSAALIFLALFVVFWTAIQIIANAAIGLHFDLLEGYAWGRHPSAGYYKHPPLPGLIPAAWFAVFPATDWSYELLAMTNAAGALYAIYLIGCRYLSGDKRLFVLILLMLLPFYHFHAQRFSTNQILLSTWPLATYCFLRAFETRSALWSIAAGATAALAMLGKYYSIYLIASFVVAALAHPARWTYLRSASPWISAASGLAVLAPHLFWLRTVEFGPFEYAYAVHGQTSIAALLRKSASYVLGGFAYVSVLFIAYAISVRPGRKDWSEILWPADPDRRMLIVMQTAMIFAPPLTAPFLGLMLSSVWTMSAWFLLPIILLAPHAIELPRLWAIRVSIAVLVFTLGVLLASPTMMWTNYKEGLKDGRAYYALLSEELARQWRATSNQPLRIVLSNFDLSAAMTFYHPDHPDSAPDRQFTAAPWITPDRLKREGWAEICPADDAGCLTAAASRLSNSAGGRRIETDITPRFFGAAGPPARYVLFLAPLNRP